MAFVPGCKHDIFVSYAHVDDVPFPGTEKGWVTTLIESVRIVLAQKLGRSDAFSLWMDHQLSRHERLTPEILSNLQQSATLLVILSPGYLASEWCLREKDSFLESLAGSPLEGSRIFLVERDRVDYEERPPQFEDLLGYRFWVQEGEGDPVQVLGVPKADPADPRQLRYFDELARVCANLADELKRLKQATGKISEQPSGGAQGGTAAAGDDRTAVYLAEVTDDLDEQANALRATLEQAGHRVLPTTWYPREPEEFRQAVDRDLARCQLFVQLLSALPGKKPPGLPEGYVRAQHQRAQEAGLPVLQWRSRQLDPAAVSDAEHRGFLDSETVMAVSLEEFKRAVVERADAGPEAEEPSPPALDEALIFVNADSGDLDLAAEVGEALEARGLAFSLPMPGGSPSEAREDLEQNLLYSDALVVIWGGASGRWVRNQLLQLRKVAWKRERPLKAVALLQGPPAVKGALGLGLPNLITLDCSEGFDAGSLEPLFEALEAAS